jgi:hypothetical protein
MFLWLSFEGIFDDSNTPLLVNVRPLAQDLVLKIVSEPVFFHEVSCFTGIAFIICRLTATRRETMSPSRVVFASTPAVQTSTG